MTDLQYKELIVGETGIRDETGDITYPVAYNNLPIWWSMILAKKTDSWLTYLYTRQAVLRYILGTLRRAKDVVIGPDQIRASQMFSNTLRELQEWNSFIALEDPEGQAVPVLRVVQSKAQEGTLDIVQEAVEFAMQVDPSGAAFLP